jgi:hypothetical protein
MESLVNPIKAIAVLLLVLTAAFFVPFLPKTPARGDPVAPSDPRIEARISSEDLAQILQLVRGSRFSNIYQRYFVQTQLPLHFIGKANPTLRLGPKQPPVQIEPAGEIEAIFSASCRPDCQDGTTYYFSKIGDRWRITKIESWVT